MATKSPLTLVRRLPSGRIPRAAIRAYVRELVAKFQPERVILFGSHAYGKPHADSDVDLLVVMPAKNDLTQALRIGRTISARFPMDLVSISPAKFEKHLGMNDPMFIEIVEKGVVLHDAVRASQSLSPPYCLRRGQAGRRAGDLAAEVGRRAAEALHLISHRVKSVSPETL